MIIHKISKAGLRVRLKQDCHVSLLTQPEVHSQRDFAQGCLRSRDQALSDFYPRFAALCAGIVGVCAIWIVAVYFRVSPAPMSAPNVYAKVHFASQTLVPVLLVFFLVLPIALWAVPDSGERRSFYRTLPPTALSYDYANSTLTVLPGYEQIALSQPLLGSQLSETAAATICSSDRGCFSQKGGKIQCPGQFVGIVQDEKTLRQFSFLPWFAAGTVAVCGKPILACPRVFRCPEVSGKVVTSSTGKITVECSMSGCQDPFLSS